MIFDDLKLILVHVPRTGGTSVEAALGKASPASLIDLASTIPPNDLIRQAGEEKWKTYHKFTIIRNPFDRLVSTFYMYHMRKKHPMDSLINNKVLSVEATPAMFASYVSIVNQMALQNPSLPDLQTNWIVSGGRFANDPMLQNLHPNGELIVDRVLRFENLEADFAKMLDEQGIARQDLPHLNRSPRQAYQSYYTDSEVQKVGRIYGPDIAKFGYSYETIGG